MFQSELKVVQDEFRDAMTENAALEGEVSQLTYEVRRSDSQFKFNITINIILYIRTVSSVSH